MKKNILAILVFHSDGVFGATKPNKRNIQLHVELRGYAEDVE